MVGQLLQVVLLLRELPLELQKLLALALADRVVLVGPLAPLESVAARKPGLLAFFCLKKKKRKKNVFLSTICPPSPILVRLRSLPSL